jgi:hypothetical protein
MVALPERIARSEEGFNEFLTVYGSRLINATAKVRPSLGQFMSRFIIAHLSAAIDGQSNHRVIL